MNIIEIVMLVVSGLATLTQVLGQTKAFWSKVPSLVKYLPAALVIFGVVGEKLAGVKTESDLVMAGVALVMLAVNHFITKKDAPKEETK